jgi:nucleoid DNA-binding protein
MAKAELIEDVARVVEMTRNDSDVIVEPIFDSWCVLYLAGIRSRSPTAARVGRNPETGARVEVPAQPTSQETAQDLSATVTGLGYGICTTMNRATRQSGGVESQERGWYSWR